MEPENDEKYSDPRHQPLARSDQQIGYPRELDFDLRHIVIGHQGVGEEARATAVHEADWLTFEASGERVSFDVLIFFPWDQQRERFRGSGDMSSRVIRHCVKNIPELRPRYFRPSNRVLPVRSFTVDLKKRGPMA
jgi:hypothetical protein